MKSLHPVFRTIHISPLATLLFVMFAASVWFSCQKEPVAPNEDPNGGTLTSQPDTSAIVAFLDPIRQVLYADPQYIELALGQLRAQSVEHGTGYQIQGHTPAGEARIIQFTVEPAPLPQPFMRSVTVEQPTGELVQAYEEKGTKYEVWRGRKCGAVRKGYDTGCVDGIPNNNFSWRSSTNDYSTCEPGNGLCVQEWNIVGQTIDYKSDQCIAIKQVTPIYAWQCY